MVSLCSLTNDTNPTNKTTTNKNTRHRLSAPCAVFNVQQPGKHSTSTSEKSALQSPHTPSFYDDIDSEHRAVFVNLHEFYYAWRSIPSLVLFKAVLIFPDVYTEWILETSLYLNVVPIPPSVAKMLSDKVFVRLLQWKYEQNCLFCTQNTKKIIESWRTARTSDQGQGTCDPFWHNMSASFARLSDPTRSESSGSTYNGLILNHNYYESSEFISHYHVSAKKIGKALASVHRITRRTLCEILYQSNPQLRIIASVVDMKCIIPQGNVTIRPSLSKLDSITTRHGVDGSIQVELDFMLEEVLESLLVSLPLDDAESVIKLSADVSMQLHEKEMQQQLQRLDLISEDVEQVLDDDANWWFAEDYESFGSADSDADTSR